MPNDEVMSAGDADAHRYKSRTVVCGSVALRRASSSARGWQEVAVAQVCTSMPVRFATTDESTTTEEKIGPLDAVD